MTSLKTQKQLQAQLEDGLRTLFSSPSALDRAAACLTGERSQQPKPQEAQQHYERAAHLADPTVFGPRAPQVTQQHVAESFLHSLLLTSRGRTPGFGHLLQLCQMQQRGNGHSTLSSPLLRLLRRVCLWYYYRVMFDPLDQLLALTSGCELLFQLMTPHQQLSCMADILLVLACPALEEHCGDIDTPLHTATLLSMLKMAQQLAMAEADLQQQEQALASISQQVNAAEQRDQHLKPGTLERLQQQQQEHMQAACDAAAVLTPPSLALLQLCRQQGVQVSGAPVSGLGSQGLWPQQDCRSLQEEFRQHFAVLLKLGTWQDRMDVLGSPEAQVALQQSMVCKLVGALLSQLSQLPHKQLLVWWHAQEPAQQQAPIPEHMTITAQWLRQCCSDLQAGSLPQLTSADQDPVVLLVALVMQAMSATPSQQQQQQQQQHHHQQQADGAQDQRPQPGSCRHPAEALRQLLDVLLSALLYRHTVSMQGFGLQDPYKTSQSTLLGTLHCHCMQLLTEAREQLPPEACTLQGQHTSSSSSGGSGGSQEQQHQRQAWHLCVSQVQHGLLLVLQLAQHWQHHNCFAGFETLLQNKMADADFLKSFINPVPGADSSPATQSAVFRLLHKKMQQMEARLFRHVQAGTQPDPADFDAFLQCTLQQRALAAVTAAAAAAGPNTRARLGPAPAAAEPLLPVAAAAGGGGGNGSPSSNRQSSGTDADGPGVAAAGAAGDTDAGSVLRLRGGRGGSSTASASDGVCAVSDDDGEQAWVQVAQDFSKAGSGAPGQESAVADEEAASELTEEAGSTAGSGDGGSEVSLSDLDAYRPRSPALPDVVSDLISDHVRFWADRAASKQQQEQQLVQGLSTAGQLPEPKWLRDLRDVPEHFVCMGRQEAAAWVELAAFCLRGSDSGYLERLADSVRDGLQLLDLPPPSSNSRSSSEDSSGTPGSFPPRYMHALFTLLLVEDGAKLGLDAECWRHAQDALLNLLDGACDTVHAETRSLQYDLHYLQQDAQEYLIRDVEAHVMDLPGHLTSTVRRQHIGQDLSGVVDAVQGWENLLKGLIRTLGPVQVRPYDRAELNDELFKSGKQLRAWVDAFLGFTRTLRDLARVEASWLARKGRSLQKHAKFFRRAERVLAAGLADPYLSGLYQRAECDAQLSATVLTNLMLVHDGLQVAMRSGLARDCWGVLQHGLNLLQQDVKQADLFHEVARARDHLQRMLQCVGCDMLRHLCSTSVHLPELPLAETAAKQLSGTFSPATMQDMLLLFSSIQGPPMSPFWMFLPDSEANISQNVGDRARGRRLPFRTVPFNSRSRSRSNRQQHNSHHHHQQQQQQESASHPPAAAEGGSSTGSSGSDSDSGDNSTAAATMMDRINKWYAFEYSTTWDAPAFRYRPEEDDAVLSSTRSAVRQAEAAAHDEQTLNRDLWELHAALVDAEQGEGVWNTEADGQRYQDMYAELQRQQQRAARSRQRAARSRQQCRRLLALRVAEQEWQQDCCESLSRNSPDGSTDDEDTSSCGSDDSSDSDSSISSSEFAGPPPGLTPAAAGTSSSRQQRLQQQQLTRLALGYDWGGFIPWQLQRAKLLAVRQQQLNRAAALQAASEAALHQLAALQASLGEHSLQRPAATQQEQQRQGSTAQEKAAASASGPDAPAAGAGSDQQLLVCVFGASGAALPGAALEGVEGLDCLQDLTGKVSAAQDPQDSHGIVLRMGQKVQHAVQQLQELCSPQGPLLQMLVAGRVQQQLQHDRVGVTGVAVAEDDTRQLLWELLGQVKPAACQWYEAAAQHHNQQQQGKDGAAGGVSVPACTSRALWSTLTASLAADLLLVPPSIRDTLGNNWAAGAGRLAGPGTDSSSSSNGDSGSIDSGTAVRMLAVQYARAARRQFVQSYRASDMLWQLLVVQLLAEEPDMLLELRQGSAAAISAVLAAQTLSAEADMRPVIAAAAEAARVQLAPSTCSKQPAQQERSSSTATSSNSRSTSAGGSSSAASSAAAAAGRFEPSLLHMAAQLCCCFPGEPTAALPWLQLLARYHALQGDVAAQHAAVRGKRDDERPRVEATHAKNLDPSICPQDRLASMAVALQSCAIPLHAAAGRLCRQVQARYEGFDNVPVLASPFSTAVAGSLQQQQQEEDREEVARMCALWLHAERLVQVQPHAWQQHLGCQLIGDTAHTTNSNGSSSSSGGYLLAADLACDWCSGPLAQAPGRDSSSKDMWGCPSCGAAQYCSQGCADAARQVHNANCWRLQALARDGLCWKQPAYQQAAHSSSRSRSLWDMSAVEQL